MKGHLETPKPPKKKKNTGGGYVAEQHKLISDRCTAFCLGFWGVDTEVETGKKGLVPQLNCNLESFCDQVLNFDVCIYDSNRIENQASPRLVSAGIILYSIGSGRNLTPM